MTNWLQLYTTLDSKHAEILEDGLLAAGASAVTMMDAEDQAILEPELGTLPLWPKTTVIGLFEEDVDIESAKKIASEIFNQQTNQACDLKVEFLENEDWTRKWIENFKPIQFGQRLWVCPSWCQPPEPGAVNLLLDPGLAFGTGTHPTTALCLEWLDQLDLEDKVIVDYGCGSGILGIAAALLGAKKVIAIDNDPQALTATLDNASRNQLTKGQVETYLPNEWNGGHADLLIANILAAPLMQLKDTMLGLLKPDAGVALSGILSHQADQIRDHYASDLSELEIIQKDDWVRVQGSLTKI